MSLTGSRVCESRIIHERLRIGASEPWDFQPFLD
jgi:hypothetical protein